MDHIPAPGPLRIGDEVPRFIARSTQGPLDLADFRGRWVVLFSHPADFTPVCTSEFIALAKAEEQFAAMECALVGLSVDSLYSHLAWIRMIHDISGVRVNFPLVEDPTMEIARAFGMIAPDAHDASAVRTSFFIDPQGVLRAATSYPVNVGRSVPEMLRLLAALRRVDAAEVLAPADWQPGDDLLRMPAETAPEILRANGPDAWFFTPVADKG
ncbi:peroxiredoxin [Altererythrobacter sp. B11]|uniref:peroxiredoxin n=1 Tax=Altererythrobacter sp. B11 TaxID=2060312 RepID=UPI000DC6E73A|nr:peroxiredoxin [Altererythrobacter sp. B11]BBC70979.1 peroxiredoxin [Altererythrobacter sp. B11]